VPSAVQYAVAATLWTGILVVVALGVGCVLAEGLLRAVRWLDRRDVDNPW
jgi:hypothetical protein